jgi:hypothetical protein
MPTDISEDRKGDLTKETPGQPVPDRRAREGIEPLLPSRDEQQEKPWRAGGAETEGDLRAEAAADPQKTPPEPDPEDEGRT